jgi:Uri superfamily endonuclease
LLLECARGGAVRVGSLGCLRFEAGTYAYVGSARGAGGLAARIAHHLGSVARPRWHIDYLRGLADATAVWFTTGPAPYEHGWAAVFARGRHIATAAPRFGSSDCSCESHLFFSVEPPSLGAFRRRLDVEGLGAAPTEWRVSGARRVP